MTSGRIISVPNDQGSHGRRRDKSQGSLAYLDFMISPALPCPSRRPSVMSQLFAHSPWEATRFDHHGYCGRRLNPTEASAKWPVTKTRLMGGKRCPLIDSSLTIELTRPVEGQCCTDRKVELDNLLFQLEC